MSDTAQIDECLCQSASEWVGFNVTLDTQQVILEMSLSGQIDSTGTDKQTQVTETLDTSETQKTNRRKLP